MRENNTIVIAVAPNGARRGKKDHEMLPLSAAELAETAAQCLQAGAAVLHLHVRDQHQQHTLDPQHYACAIKAIRERIGERLLIQVTTEAAGVCTLEQQMHAIEKTRPEAFSLALREFIPADNHAISQDQDKVALFLRRQWKKGVWLQYILYEPSEIRRFFLLRSKGIIPGIAHSLLFVIGRHQKAEQNPDHGDLEKFLNELNALDEDDYEWMACAFDNAEYPCCRYAALKGGDIRVGFENNLNNRFHQRATNNAELVAQAAAAAIHSGKTSMTADQLRDHLAEYSIIHAPGE